MLVFKRLRYIWTVIPAPQSDVRTSRCPVLTGLRRRDGVTHLAEHFPDAQQREVPLSILVDYVANSVLTLLRWWLDHDMPYSPEQMDEFFYKMVMPGVLKATGQAA